MTTPIKEAAKKEKLYKTPTMSKRKLAAHASRAGNPVLSETP